MIEQARQVLRMEAAAIEALIPRIDEQFVLAAQLIWKLRAGSLLPAWASRAM